ncbi:hypothetical protein BDQ17DRAFT_1250698 [Cyathus striatus]|nr:hypothetical protein BDQ17DRAFT_1250698 [Cyathus striatus]
MTSIPTTSYDPTSTTASTPRFPLGNISVSRQSSTSLNKGKTNDLESSDGAKSPQQLKISPTILPSKGDTAKWGSNFWVTLVDPQTQTSFYACPATGQVSWDPPVGSFVLPPSAEGEWWELADDTRGGLPYYYHTKTGETVWERPGGFVIPLSIIQNSALSRRLSRIDKTDHDYQEAKTFHSRERNSLQGKPPVTHASLTTEPRKRAVHRTASKDNYYKIHPNSQLTPIPGSPYTTEMSEPPSPASNKSQLPLNQVRQLQVTKTFWLSHLSIHPHGKLQYMLELANYERNTEYAKSPVSESVTTSELRGSDDNSSMSRRSTSPLPLPSRSTLPVPKTEGSVKIGGKFISAPILNHAATQEMSPVKNRATGQPIVIEFNADINDDNSFSKSLRTHTYPILPNDLATDIQHFSESEYARQYFSTHRSGFIFKRRVPVLQLMTWQKTPLSSSLLTLNKALQKNSITIFKVIQHLMGDREREKPATFRLQNDTSNSMTSPVNASSTSLSVNSIGLLEEERWLLGEGLTHGELRDEIFCQLMKQLTANPNTESIFKGWQLLCVLLITFPPSKDFETYLHGFIQKHTTQQEGRVDIMAKYCLRRLATISMKGPRGKPPNVVEIETASDAAFNPSTFGESLDGIIRLQERNYPHQKVPIILPFLADGILALGGPKVEGIFRVPGDADSVSELKLRIDRGYYTLDGVDDPHVLASLLKLWLRELCDPLVPDEMYNECILNAKDPEECIRIIERLPTINRRVLLFVVSFLQLFLDEKTQASTKMTPANMALVMAPNLLRCSSQSVSVVFTNAQYEQIFVYNLLLHLKCDEIDSDFKPTHGLAALPTTPVPKSLKGRRGR